MGMDDKSMLYIASFTCVSNGLVCERGLDFWLVDVDDRKCVAGLWTGDSTGHTTPAVPGPPPKYTVLRQSTLIFCSINDDTFCLKNVIVQT